MRLFLLATLMLTAAQVDSVQGLMQDAFYPALLLILIFASLGVPIPEDIPLIAAGVLLRTQPGVASWPGTIFIALVGIMSGDLVLYALGRRWGPGVVNHRSVRWLIPPWRFARMSRKFRRYGAWMVFFGRFLMGIRAAMCLTAGATRFHYWRFLLADFAGALLSVPFFVVLGYWFAGMVPTLRTYVSGVEALILAGLAVAIAVAATVYYARKRRPPVVVVASSRDDSTSGACPELSRSAGGPMPALSDAERSAEPVGAGRGADAPPESVPVEVEGLP